MNLEVIKEGLPQVWTHPAASILGHPRASFSGSSAKRTRDRQTGVQETGRGTKRALADAGYRSEKNLLHLERTGIDGFVALGREKKDSPPTSNSKLEATLRMKAKLKTKRGRKWYKRRKLGEPPFGWIKAVLGFQSFSLRGLEKTSAEWNLVCLALNLRRLNQKMVWV